LRTETAAPPFQHYHSQSLEVFFCHELSRTFTVESSLHSFISGQVMNHKWYMEIHSPFEQEEA
jgi:hypothetical protein